MWCSLHVCHEGCLNEIDMRVGQYALRLIIEHCEDDFDVPQQVAAVSLWKKRIEHYERRKNVVLCTPCPSPLPTNLVSNIPESPHGIPPRFGHCLRGYQHACPSDQAQILTDSKNTPVNMTPTNACSMPFKYTLRSLWSSSWLIGRYAGTRRCSVGQSLGFCCDCVDDVFGAGCALRLVSSPSL